jgi:hypothetical protein
MDVTGFIIVALAASGIVFGLSVISLPALPPFVGGAAVMIGIVASAAYLFHATASCKPDSRLLPVSQTECSEPAIVGGSMFRIGSGALPFLLPLLFQLGFGMTPFESGSLTFATALGAMVMKFVAPGLLRLAGFRNVLILAGLITACFTAGNILFTPLTPHLVILVGAAGGGFSRSMFFTSANALVFADARRQAG